MMKLIIYLHYNLGLLNFSIKTKCNEYLIDLPNSHNDFIHSHLKWKQLADFLGIKNLLQLQLLSTSPWSTLSLHSKTAAAITTQKPLKKKKNHIWSSPTKFTPFHISFSDQKIKHTNPKTKKRKKKCGSIFYYR